MIFNDIVRRYVAKVTTASEEVFTEGTQIGPWTHEGVAYTVRWGAEANKHVMNTVDVVIIFTGPNGRRVKVADLPAAGWHVSRRGYKRLNAWRDGSGPFPETADALFAEE